MTSDFVGWLSGNRRQICDEAYGLFTDSVKCTRAEIYRPAYLLAYQGLMVLIREAVRRGKAPKGFTAEEWKKKVSDVSRDSGWDEAVYQIVRQEGKDGKAAPLFIPSDVRRQFEYWRIHRNICAHYKSEPFVKAHVLTLYEFVRSWGLRITVEGGMDVFLERLEAYYDPARTKPGTPVAPLVAAIPTYVNVDEVDAFVEKAVAAIDSSPHGDAVDFADIVLQEPDNSLQYVRDAFFRYVKKDESFFFKLVTRRPDYILNIVTKKEDIRAFWHVMPLWLDVEVYLRIICQFVEAGKIEVGEYAELCEIIQDSLLDKDRALPVVSEAVKSVLIKVGYFKSFMDRSMSRHIINVHSNFSKLCHRSRFYISHLSQVPLGKDVVATIIDRLAPGTSAPYTIRDRFVDDILNNSDTSYRDDFERIAAANGLSMPEEWKGRRRGATDSGNLPPISPVP